MLTEKQMAAFNAYLKETSLEDLPTPDMPSINLPNWLPDGVQKKFMGYIATVSAHKHQESRLFVDMWPYFVQETEFILPMFTADMMKDCWDELYCLSTESAERLAGSLIMMGNDFDGAIRMYEKHQAEKQCCNRMIKQIDGLIETMEEYHCHYFGHMIQENHHEVMETLQSLSEKTKDDLDAFAGDTKDISYLFSDTSPITREFKAENAKPIFFARKLFIFFKKEYGRPFHAYNADIISLLFDKHYSENDIIKITKKVRALIECENS